jgi:hypothetical protein
MGEMKGRGKENEAAADVTQKKNVPSTVHPLLSRKEERSRSSLKFCGLFL